jgi:2-methylcitrate dehydratase PrpD
VVARPDVVALRARVVATVDESIREKSMNLTVVCRDGRHLHRRVEHAIGSLERPITDGGLEERFRSHADGVVRESAQRCRDRTLSAPR